MLGDVTGAFSWKVLIVVFPEGFSLLGIGIVNVNNVPCTGITLVYCIQYLYLYESTICPHMEYCCHVWAGAPSCYLDLLDKLQKWICRIVGPSLAVSLEPLAHHRNVASLTLFCRYYFGRCSPELAQLVPLAFS